MPCRSACRRRPYVQWWPKWSLQKIGRRQKTLRAMCTADNINLWLPIRSLEEHILCRKHLSSCHKQFFVRSSRFANAGTRSEDAESCSSFAKSYLAFIRSHIENAGFNREKTVLNLSMVDNKKLVPALSSRSESAPDFL